MVVALVRAQVGGVREQRDLAGVVHVVVDNAMRHRVRWVAVADETARSSGRRAGPNQARPAASPW